MSSDSRYYWIGNPDAPYSTFLNVIQAYLHPDVNTPDDLKEAANRSNSVKMARFKDEFREILADPKVLPQDALYFAAVHEDETDQEFLTNLWNYLYGDESPTATTKDSPTKSPGDAQQEGP